MSRNRALALVVLGPLCAVLAAAACGDDANSPPFEPADAGTPDNMSYPDMPAIAPPNSRVPDYVDVPESALGPAIDPEKGYAVTLIRNGVYWVTEGAYQAMFVVTDTGVVVVDAPPTIGAKLLDAIASVTPLPVTHLVYSHAHIDHIGAADLFPASALIVAHEDTAALLTRANDPHRPVPEQAFADSSTLETGGKTLQLIYPGPNHEEGNIIVYLPDDKVAMIVDVVYPRWMPWRRLGVARDIPGLFTTVDELLELDFDTVVTGHVGRVGDRTDVEEAKEFLVDLRTAAGNGLAMVELSTVGADLREEDRANPWAFFRGYIDRVVIHCVNELTPKWSRRLAAFDVWIYDQCIAMEQSLRID